MNRKTLADLEAPLGLPRIDPDLRMAALGQKIEAHKPPAGVRAIVELEREMLGERAKVPEIAERLDAMLRLRTIRAVTAEVQALVRDEGDEVSDED